MLFIMNHALVWEFSAESVSLLFVQLVMVGVACIQNVKVWVGYLVISLYPISLILVILLEMAGLN